MTITPLTRTDGSAGRRKEDARPIINLLKQLAAGEWNNIADAVIELQTEFNALTGGTTIVDEDFAGAFTGTLTRTGTGAYAARRDNVSASAPSTSADAENGYASGSLWVQIEGYPGPYDGAPTHTLWTCVDPTTAAAAWVQIGAPPTTATRAISADDAIADDDDFLFVTTASAAVVLTLPVPSAGLVFAIKKTNEGTYPISLNPNASESIEGGTGGSAFTLPSSDIALRGSWTIVCDGADWWLV